MRCLYVALCPFCAAGQVASRTGGGYLADCFTIPWISHCCVWAFTRQRLRDQFEIQDLDSELENGGVHEPESERSFHSFNNDCFDMVFCAPCLLCQELNELDIRKQHAAASPRQQTMAAVMPLALPRPGPAPTRSRISATRAGHEDHRQLEARLQVERDHHRQGYGLYRSRRVDTLTMESASGDWQGYGLYRSRRVDTMTMSLPVAREQRGSR